MSKIRVGLVFGKRKSLVMGPFIEYLRSKDDLEVIVFDFENSETFVPVDVILHKLTDDMASSDPESKKRMQTFTEFLDKYKQIVVIEDFEKLNVMMDRYQMNLSFQTKLNSDIVNIPKFFKITERDDLFSMNGLEFPVICKPFNACGTQSSHDLVLAFNLEQVFHLFDKREIEIPFIVQEYINHDHTVHKIYVMSNTTIITQRGSSRNVTKDSEMIKFDSQKAWPIELQAESTNLIAPPSLETVHKISEDIRRALGIDLLGYDLITKSKTQDLYLIDVNYFPGYKNVEGFEHSLYEYVMDRLNKSKK